MLLAVALGGNAKSADGGASATDPAVVAAAAQPNAGRCTLRDGVFRNGSRSTKMIALTFDACPTSLQPAFADDVVRHLEDSATPATFFVSGEWADANPEALARLNGKPFFEIALHGHRHPRLTDATPAQVRAEIEDGRAALLRHGITPVPFFRAPYADNPPDLASVARESGVLAVMGDGGLGDPDPNRTAPIMERDAIRWFQAGSVVILHVNGRGHATADTVAHLVPLLRSRGYEFVRISELVRSCDLAE